MCDPVVNIAFEFCKLSFLNFLKITQEKCDIHLYVKQWSYITLTIYSEKTVLLQFTDIPREGGSRRSARPLNPRCTYCQNFPFNVWCPKQIIQSTFTHGFDVAWRIYPSTSETGNVFSVIQRRSVRLCHHGSLWRHSIVYCDFIRLFFLMIVQLLQLLRLHC